MRISLARSVSNRLGGLRRHLARRSRVTYGDRSGRVSTAIECPAPKGLARLKLGPVSNILSPIATRLLNAEANCYVTHVSVDAKNHFHIGEEPTEAWIPQRFADQRLLTPFLAFLSGIRALVAGLILVALIPNLTLGAIFWLGVIDTPWSRPATHPPNESSVPAAQSAVPSPVLSSPAMLEATAGGDITFPIALDGTDGVPARSIIAIRGLPQGSKLSSGRPYDETEWNLKPDEIGDLHLVLPRNASGEAKLMIQLVATDGAIIADAATVLKMTTDSTANVGASNIKTELAEPQVRDVQAEGLGATGGEKRLANLDAATTMSGYPIPLPSRRPAPIANDDGANWIKPLAFVNLRQKPTRSAPAISVVAKGAKLRVMGRKKRWLQVTNPATSESGWIYAANIATVR
jgi:SH3 domain-containing protein